MVQFKYFRETEMKFAIEFFSLLLQVEIHQTYSVELDRGLNLLPLTFFLLPPILPERDQRIK